MIYLYFTYSTPPVNICNPKNPGIWTYAKTYPSCRFLWKIRPYLPLQIAGKSAMLEEKTESRVALFGMGYKFNV